MITVYGRAFSRLRVDVSEIALLDATAYFAEHYFMATQSL